jgi:hypothetical protein
MLDAMSFTRASSVESRAITAENPRGERGVGGQAASNLGPTRKGAPCTEIEAGQTITLADVTGSGTIRHIWMTITPHTENAPFVLRNLALRMFWDGEESPSVEVPLGDFFCCGFGEPARVQSMPITVAPKGGMNCYFPMPFTEGARIELVSEHPEKIGGVFYQIDYTLGDEHPEDQGRFHAHWRRCDGRDPLGTDHMLLDLPAGSRGSYVGSFIQLTALERYWWGEGEMKFFLDGDQQFPTICGTGLEDYVGGAWAFQDHQKRWPAPIPETYSAPFLGYSQYLTEDTSEMSGFATGMPPCHGMYRFHLPDPIYFHDGLRVTLQQIGERDGHFERQDDIATVAYWYQTGRTEPLPALPAADRRQPR